MSVYQVAIENRVYQVNIMEDRCTVDGATVDARVVRLNRNGLHLIWRGKQVLEFFLNPLGDETYQMVLLGGRRIVTNISSHPRKHAKAGIAENQDQILTAPMPGLVLDVRVHEGDWVDTEKTLVVLESMKMQMRLHARQGGQVARVNVQPGCQVEKGAVLIQFMQPGPGEESHE